MKKIGKITLSRKYDVLSENEMKLVIGGSGSGSGSEIDNCIGKIYYTCYEENEMFASKGCADNINDAKSGYCSMAGRGEDCLSKVTCIAG